MTRCDAQGGCQCGAVRYTLAVEQIPVYACHCLECQKQSASAFGLSAPLPADALAISGPLQCYERPTDSGSTTRCWFCSVCGTRLYHQSARSPEVITLKAGSLDHIGDLRPVAHIWTKRKQAWLALPPNAVTYDTQPDDLKAWRRTLMTSSQAG